MNSIHIELQKDYMSLQQGFAWRNIPMFCVITGINGAGKTHLLKLLYESATNSNLLKVTNNGRNTMRLVVPMNNDLKSVASNNSLHLRDHQGFIGYFSSTDNRLAAEKQIQQKIDTYENIIKRKISEREQIKSIPNTDKGSILHKEKEIREHEKILENFRNQLASLYDPVYEEEIANICKRLDKDKESVTIDDIKNNAKTTFEGVLEIDSIQRYIADELQYKRIAVLEESDTDKIKEIREELESYQIINQLFVKYGFDYYTMNNPNPEMHLDRHNINVTPEKIQLSFKGKKDEQVTYEDLSSGEKIIVKIIMLARSKNTNGENVNTIILDEPDAHLHPSLCKMMIEILQDLTKSSEEGGANLRVIISTHSPSTVAFTPELSLFLIKRNHNGDRTIGLTTKDEAINILSNGILTFKEAMGKFELISGSSKKNILCVEGKTDVAHLSMAMEKLNRSIDVEIIDLHDAGTLANFVKSIPASILGGKRIIGLFDNDKAGTSNYRQIAGAEQDGYKQLSAEQSKGFAYVCYLPAPKESLENHCPIEFLYPLEVLKANDMLAKRNFSEFKSAYKARTPEEDNALNDEYQADGTHRVFTVKDSNKNRFSKNLYSLESSAFVGFGKLFDLLEKIIEN